MDRAQNGMAPVYLPRRMSQARVWPALILILLLILILSVLKPLILGLLRKSGHRSCVMHGLVVLVFEVNWTEIVQRAVEATAIVKGFNEVEEGVPGLSSGVEL
jgi:hypothetical protein